jgi:SAM-dependent methyltransferase
VRAFRYAFDPLCLAACLFYAANRWIAQPLCGWPILHGHLNDLLLIPAALPLTLGIQKWTGLRSHDLPPTIPEIFGHLLAWSLVAELAAPSIFPWAIGDPYDVLAYSVGAIFAAAWWNGSAIAERARGALKPAKIAQFDPLASHYDWMELLLAGRKLESCRNALWNEIPFLEDALLVGEGHGKFLAALVRRNPNARVTYVDASAKMLEVARQRLVRAALPIDHVEFVRAELPAWKPSPQRYDLIVTHFFLDCLPHEQLSAVIKTLKRGRAAGCLLAHIGLLDTSSWSGASPCANHPPPDVRVLSCGHKASRCRACPAPAFPATVRFRPSVPR